MLTLAAADGHAHAADAGHAAHGAHEIVMGLPVLKSIGELPRWVLLIPFMPLLGCVLATLCAIFKVKTKLPAFLTVLCLLVAFGAAVGMFLKTTGDTGDGANARWAVVHAWDWINFGFSDCSKTEATHRLVANFSFYVDALTCLWMLFVTGLATLIALYASEYMSHDVGMGYCRFFAAFNLFVFSMACLVMGDNLVLLFLGWEGVGLCSYLLIGYFYKKPSAVAAAKKAFIMNRIGDLGLSMGIMLAFVQFGTLEYASHEMMLNGTKVQVAGLFEQIQPYLIMAQEHRFSEIPLLVQLIPILLTIGAFGKSAQVFLFVWLPDAMEGPTPVSALIHAATMVTAGVYLVARFYPFFLASEYALSIVAWGGALTALVSATIGMAQFDIKRIMAYSTVSQLGYMFCGIGVMGVAGGVGHVFTHAFFKALLFLACGAVMHGFAGQLDLRKLSGVAKMPGWRIVGITMFIGCINLAGLPFITAGFFSKDMILGDAFGNKATQPIGWILLFTAGLTAYYTFRVFFRVFVGPRYFEAGDEVHAHDDHGHDAHGHDHGHAAAHGAHASHGHGQDAHATHDFHPHPPGWAINLVLSIIAVAVCAVIPLFTLFKSKGVPGWVASMVEGSTSGADYPVPHESFLGMDAHTGAMYASIVVAIVGVLIAAFLHGPKGIESLFLGNRTTAAKSRADALLPLFGPLARGAQHKWYVDEIYDWVFVKPLYVLSHIFHLIDKLLVDGLVNAFGWFPRGIGLAARRQQSGVLHDYALRMAMGVALVVVIAVLVKTGGLS